MLEEESTQTGPGPRKQEVLSRRSDSDGDFSARTLDRALAWLVKQGEVGEKQLTNERGKPKVYWRAYNPPGGGEEGEGFISTKPPSRNGENKSENSKSSASPEEDYLSDLEDIYPEEDEE